MIYRILRIVAFVLWVLCGISGDWVRATAWLAIVLATNALIEIEELKVKKE